MSFCSRFCVSCHLALIALLGAPCARAADPISTALAACAAMQERFEGTQCTATPVEGGYRVTVRAASPDAMRVVFMRSLDVADGLCGAGSRVELVQELESGGEIRTVRWRVEPPKCGISRAEA